MSSWGDWNFVAAIEGTGRKKIVVAGRRTESSGTENIYKIYAESFQSQTHLHTIVGEAQAT
jgi:phosphoglucomutase